MTHVLSYSPLPPDPGSRSSSRRFMVSPALSDQQTQLDDIIGDLLSDKAFMTDHGEINPFDMNGIVMPQHGCITTQDGNSRTVLSWQTHQSGPNRSLRTPSASRAGSRAGSRPASRAGSRPSSRARVDLEGARDRLEQSMSGGVSAFPGGVSGSSGLPGGVTSSSMYEESFSKTDKGQHHKTSEERKYSSYQESTSSKSGWEDQSKSGINGWGNQIKLGTTGWGDQNKPGTRGWEDQFKSGTSGTSGWEYEAKSSKSEWHNGEFAPPVPPRTDSKTPPPPPVRTRKFSLDQLTDSDVNRSSPYKGTTLNKPLSETRQSRQFTSDTENLSSSWFESQKSKLYEKRDSRTESEQFIHKTPARSKPEPPYRGHSDTEEGPAPARPPLPLSSYESLDELSNFLTESSRDISDWQYQGSNVQKSQKTYHVAQSERPRSSSAQGPLQDTEPVFFVSGLEKPAFSNKQTKYVFSVSPSPTSMIRDDSLEDQFKRDSAMSPPPPRRGDSSKQAVQRRNVEPDRTVPSVDELDAALAKILADSKPEPEDDLWIDEEIISLEPIGRGIHTLEPDTVTLSRNRDRSRTASPVYPGFPSPGYRSPSLGRMRGEETPTRFTRTPPPPSYSTLTQGQTNQSQASTSTRLGESVERPVTREAVIEEYRSMSKESAMGDVRSSSISNTVTGSADRRPNLDTTTSQRPNQNITTPQRPNFETTASQRTNQETAASASQNYSASTTQSVEVVEEPVLVAAKSHRDEQIHRAPEQLASLTRGSTPNYSSAPTPVRFTPTPTPARDVQANAQQQQQQNYEAQQSSLQQQSEKVYKQQQQVQQHSEQLQKLQLEQQALREKQQQLQKEQQELLQQQRNRQQQLQQQQPSRNVQVVEETVTYARSSDQKQRANVTNSANLSNSANVGNSVSASALNSADINNSASVASAQKTKTDNDLEREMLEIEREIQQGNIGISQQSHNVRVEGVGSHNSHNAGCSLTHQHQACNHVGAGSTSQQGNLSQSSRFEQQQRGGEIKEHVYSSVSKVKGSESAQASSNSRLQATGTAGLQATNAGREFQSAGSSQYGQSTNREFQSAGSSQYGQIQSAQSAAQLQSTSSSHYGQIQSSNTSQSKQTEAGSSAGRVNYKSADNLYRSDRTEVKQSEEYNEQLYATVPSKPTSNSTTALTVESANQQQNLTSRSPSPSLWTTDTLRSYTDRAHSRSVSPLFHPGQSNTLPRGQPNLTRGQYGQTLVQRTVSPCFSQQRSETMSTTSEMDSMVQMEKFVRDCSSLWHKPNITREEAISILKDKPAGCFIVRNSSTFHGAYGLALKVSQIPANIQSKGGDLQAELVRHFLIEPTTRGVRLKGCSNEPVFGSLAALVYQHTITPLALPCKLILPDCSGLLSAELSGQKTGGVLAQGAACNVLYLNSLNTESLTGSSALSKTIKATFKNDRQPKTTLVEFKVTTQGITLTDNQRNLFFRRHYPMNTVTYCGIDEGERRWNPSGEKSNESVGGRVFGFVARKAGSLTENACHIFVESDPTQPASSIVDFITKIMIRQGQEIKT